MNIVYCSKPVITTDTGGQKEIFTDGECGFIVPLQSSEIIASKLRWLITHNSEAISMGLRGRNIVAEKFGLDDMAKKNDIFYKCLEQH